MEELLTLLAGAFEIPIIERTQKIWFLRTKGGKYYYDYRINNFVALGWNKILPQIIVDEKISDREKKLKVEEVYPEEKRPGLILSQMNVFYKQMKSGDLIIIPSRNSKIISIGILGDCVEVVNHQVEDEEYPLCNYEHKRSVKWLKEIASWRDIYLFKELRAQQTISDITLCSDLIYRNLFSCYVSQNNVHITLNKVTKTEYSASDNLQLLSSMLSIIDDMSELYGGEKLRDSVSIKTAVGSPGFIELILPGIPSSAIAAIILVKFIIGKGKSQDGSTVTGIMAVVSKVNDLINDYVKRQKELAEKELVLAQVEKTKAETRKIETEIRTLQSQIKTMESNNSEEDILAVKQKKIEIEVPETNLVQMKAGTISKNINVLKDVVYKSGMQNFDFRE